MTLIFYDTLSASIFPYQRWEEYFRVCNEQNIFVSAMSKIGIYMTYDVFSDSSLIRGIPPAAQASMFCMILRLSHHISDDCSWVAWCIYDMVFYEIYAILMIFSIVLFTMFYVIANDIVTYLSYCFCWWAILSCIWSHMFTV